jgi:hypothetical protein
LYVVSAANFANVNSNGNANCNNASNANGVRPVVGPLDFATAHDEQSSVQLCERKGCPFVGTPR